MPQSPHLPDRIAAIRDELRSISPDLLARRTAARFSPSAQDQGEFELDFWGKKILITYPDFIARDAQLGKELSLDAQGVLAYYFLTSDGEPEAGRWVSFADLPGGRFYARAYQGYSGDELVKAFQNDLEQFSSAAGRVGGQPLPLGDRAYAFRALPRVPLSVVYWQGDEDFPASAQVLFDASAGHHLPIDVCAILGGMLAGRLVRARNTP
ncbi:MAG: DUF3786 domain-containing protein [Chloroflexota bacterium]|nr:MAG: DUF3786 domain-containing protein [Chloroflexota bacterium]